MQIPIYEPLIIFKDSELKENTIFTNYCDVCYAFEDGNISESVLNEMQEMFSLMHVKLVHVVKNTEFEQYVSTYPDRRFCVAWDDIPNYNEIMDFVRYKNIGYVFNYDINK